MEQQDPLAQLRDIHLPDPVGFWPLAPGWWILGLLILILLGVALRFLIKRYRNNRYRKQALSKL